MLFQEILYNNNFQTIDTKYPTILKSVTSQLIMAFTYLFLRLMPHSVLMPDAIL